VKSFLGETVEI